MITARNIGILLGLFFAACTILFVLLIAIRDTIHRFNRIHKEVPDLTVAIRFFKVFMLFVLFLLRMSVDGFAILVMLICVILKSKRSRQENGQDYETDLTVLTPQEIYVLEVKNWKGKVVGDGEQRYWKHIFDGKEVDRYNAF